MTVVNGIESEELKVRKNDIKSAIAYNDRIEEKLHVVIVISNPCEYKRRWTLAKEFMERMSDNDDVILYVTELAYGDQSFKVTSPTNPNHLQLRTDTAPLWHKESMINVAIDKLLPADWKAVAWIDSDVEFENPMWAGDTLKILNGCKDIVQVFSHCLDMAKDESTMQVFHSFGFQYETGKKFCDKGVNYWHPGFGLACTRKCYDRMGGLFSYGILGSGDNQMARAILGYTNSVHPDTTLGYMDKLTAYVRKVRSMRMGYTPGVIKHHFHGSKKNRQYMERWKILIKHNYDPNIHVTFDANGLIIPSAGCPPELLSDIMKYFQERKEDE